jgi:deoxycytidylate deaminase
LPPAPTIIDFSAERPDYWVGETARLQVRYAGGAGRIEPAIGAVSDGSSPVTPVLDGDRSFRLIVEGPQGRVERELRLTARHRDGYVVVGNFLSVGHEALPLQDGSVLLIGGSRQEGVLSHRITRFDTRLRLFSDIGSLQVGRVDHRATLLSSGDVLITGGETSLPQPRLIELIETRTGSAQAAGELAVKRSAHTATLLQDGRVLIAGGYAGVPLGVTDRAEIWDPSTRRSVELAARMASPRAAHSATRLADGRVLLVGGYAPASAAYFGAELFDPRTGTFQPVAGYENAMRLLHAAQLQSGTASSAALRSHPPAPGADGATGRGSLGCPHGR